MTVVVIGDNTGDDYSGTLDSFIREDTPTTNNGGQPFMFVNKHVAGQYMHGYLEFDGLSNIPLNVVVTDASVKPYLNFGNSTNSNTISLKRFLVNPEELEITWNDYSSGNSWTTAGGLSDGNDRSATISASVSFPGQTYGYITFTGSQLITDVQNYIYGVYNNNGWHMERIDAADDGDLRRFTSRTGADGQRPYLSVTYNIVTPWYYYAQQ